MPIRLRGGRWPDEWEPEGWANGRHEPFEGWWARHGRKFPGLHPRIVEQWVYRHWQYSPYFGSPLVSARSTLARLRTAQFLDDVGSADIAGLRPDDPPFDPEWTYTGFNHPDVQDMEPTPSMNLTGSWGEWPVVLAASDDGFEYQGRLYPQRLWLIEGHKRMRYLRALAFRGKAAHDHEAFVLRIGGTEK